ncbi:hypothetical protein PEC311524_16960 [Pectobacterium carotovorum subsp. carotovorum]|nr:hypothetical protein PEC311524_16960 [Pectobacterium carotovorum subsp. carotovorum]
MVMSFFGLCSRCQDSTLLTRRCEGFFSHLFSILRHSLFTQTLRLFSFLIHEYLTQFSLGSWMARVYFQSAIGLIRKPNLVSELNVTRCKAVR